MKVEIVRDDLENEEESELEVSDSADVEDVLEELGVEPQEVLVSRDGTILTEKHEIEPGDRLRVMDVIAGG